MVMITGAITTGGSRRVTNPVPRRRTAPDRMMYRIPAAIRPPRVSSRPNRPLAAMIGAINAKDDARKIGIWPPVTTWKIREPIPAVYRATFGSSPVISGISTGRRRPPAASGSRPAPASRPGRCYGPAYSDVLLLGAEDLVAGIAQARQDVAFLVQAFVN